MEIKQKKGISLIVLAITVIVMIILAAAIILSLNSSGIIGKANDATAKSNKANMLEAANMAYSEYELAKQLGELTPSNKTADEYVKEKLGAQFTAEELETISIISDGTIQVNPTIPEGFVMSPYEGEQKISDGLVIYEATAAELSGITNDEAKVTYNQFVWIPVDDITKAVESFWDEPSSVGYSNEIQEYEAMYESVESNGGFYIARYEAGKEDTNKVVSKKNANVWNLIPWGVSRSEIGTAGAVYQSQKMYQNSNSVVSTLCYGLQWNAALQFVAKKDPTYLEDDTRGYYPEDSSEVTITGYFDINNIYDLGGNVGEWSMTTSDYDSFAMPVVRGLYYPNYSDGANFIAEDAGSFIGFRVALYLK